MMNSFPDPVFSPFDETEVLVFGTDEPGLAPIDFSSCPCERSWHQNLSAVKRDISRRLQQIDADIPISLAFSKVGNTYTRDSYARGAFTGSRTFVQINPNIANLIEGTSVIPAGNYLSITSECDVMTPHCHGRCAGVMGARTIFEKADESGIAVEDECWVETFLDPLALRKGKVETLFRVRARILD